MTYIFWDNQAVIKAAPFPTPAFLRDTTPCLTIGSMNQLLQSLLALFGSMGKTTLHTL
jgi:hypothetical protein